MYKTGLVRFIVHLGKTTIALQNANMAMAIKADTRPPTRRSKSIAKKSKKTHNRANYLPPP
jgi:hypothetical protein